MAHHFREPVRLQRSRVVIEQQQVFALRSLGREVVHGRIIEGLRIIQHPDIGQIQRAQAMQVFDSRRFGTTVVDQQDFVIGPLRMGKQRFDTAIEQAKLIAGRDQDGYLGLGGMLVNHPETARIKPGLQIGLNLAALQMRPERIGMTLVGIRFKFDGLAVEQDFGQMVDRRRAEPLGKAQGIVVRRCRSERAIHSAQRQIFLATQQQKATQVGVAAQMIEIEIGTQDRGARPQQRIEQVFIGINQPGLRSFEQAQSQQHQGIGRNLVTRLNEAEPLLRPGPGNFFGQGGREMVKLQPGQLAAQIAGAGQRRNHHELHMLVLLLSKAGQRRDEFALAGAACIHEHGESRLRKRLQTRFDPAAFSRLQLASRQPLLVRRHRIALDRFGVAPRQNGLPAGVDPGPAMPLVRFQMAAFAPLVPGIDKDQPLRFSLFRHRLLHRGRQPFGKTGRTGAHHDGRSLLAAARRIVP